MTRRSQHSSQPGWTGGWPMIRPAVCKPSMPASRNLTTCGGHNRRYCCTVCRARNLSVYQNTATQTCQRCVTGHDGPAPAGGWCSAPRCCSSPTGRRSWYLGALTTTTLPGSTSRLSSSSMCELCCPNRAAWPFRLSPSSVPHQGAGSADQGPAECTDSSNLQAGPHLTWPDPKS